MVSLRKVFIPLAVIVAVIAVAVWIGPQMHQGATIPLSVPDTTRADYEPLLPMQIGGVSVMASVADSPEERQQGLSGTTMLPEDVVKLFVFDDNNRWSFWMKDMRYAIDMLWVNEGEEIVHIERAVAPETYPAQSFTPPVPARYVIETVAGFSEKQQLATGTKVVLPDGL